ncbi:MAG TPA: 3-deoxy-7-phosphoheptulonate synthase [Sphingomicrobium sp.]|jgi:3-deoxy-7-phosphoheptulonate synthase|nr:3-deoxy-7-phosphoheptulonate synthase [Sphingomicrobium sp.]
MTTGQLHGLAALRAELDQIDDQILDLIERRLAASSEIAALKDAEGDRHLKLRPRRQAQILERLKGRVRIAAPELVERIWREIMAHSLQSQAKTELVLAPCDQPELLEARVRAHFGSAAPIRWAASMSHALRSALRCEAVAIVPEPLPQGEGQLRLIDLLRSEDGNVVAYAAGRVASDDIAIEILDRKAFEGPIRTTNWSPGSWRERPAQQLVDYPHPDALGRVERRLSGSEPLVEIADIIHLRAALSRVASRDAFIVQGGDCAESFAEFNADKVRVTYSLLLRMGAMLRAAGTDVVHLARIAGQFAKPRSSASETVDGVTLPSYRGDAVNGPAFTASVRAPDPKRLLDAHRQAQVTIELLQAYASASYADLPRVHREVGLKEPSRPVAMFTSHEALMLNYEQALTRFDEPSEQWWATSGHMVWIGDRTRQLDGAHVEFARGVGNPVGLKCGPGLSPDELLRLMDRLDPDNVPGRLVLIGRFGARNIAEHLPELMRSTLREGRHAIWSIDAMHGNTRTIDGLKTRVVGDIVAEIRSFFEVAGAEGVHPGGVHLEMTGGDVTECIGGSPELAREDLGKRYLTHCDPRLNERQALDVAQVISQLLLERSARADAA